MTLRPHCLRCGSANVHRDDDELIGRASIACFKCGNRQYQGTDYVGFEMREDGSSPAPSTNREVDVMAAKGNCSNCGREMTIVGNDRCFVCYTAGKGLVGTPLDAALAAVKEKIASGGLRRGGRSKAATIPESSSPQTTPLSKARATVIRNQQNQLSEKGVHSAIEFHKQSPQENPVTIRLTIEVDVRVTGGRP